MKKKIKYTKLLLIIIIILLFIALFGLIFKLFTSFPLYNSDLKYQTEYIPSEANGNVDVSSFLSINEDFAIGANKYGYAVFKDPDKAFKTLKKEYKDGINLIKKEYKLPPLLRSTYQLYKSYGFQAQSDSLKETLEARFVSRFLDIYENSFTK